MSAVSGRDLRSLKRHLPLQVPWGELGAVGKVRRVVFWASMLGNVGLVASAMTSGSDQHIKADGTKRTKSDHTPDVQGAPPQREQADEDPADEKRDEPERQEGNAASTAETSA